MDLQLDTEHTILAGSAERFLSENYDYSARHGDTGDGGAWQDDMWGRFAELGWLIAVGVFALGGQFAMMKDCSAPIFVRGRHWGGVRVAYKI